MIKSMHKWKTLRLRYYIVMQLWNREQEEEAEIPKKKGAEGQGHLKPGKDKNGGESKLTSDETHKESESANRVRGKGLGRRRHGWHSRCHGKRTRRGTNPTNAANGTRSCKGSNGEAGGWKRNKKTKNEEQNNG